VYDVEGPIVLERGHATADILQKLQFNISDDDCRVNAALGEKFAPGRYDETVPEGFATVLVCSTLGRR
jgi:hypothetical protein